MSLVRPNPSFQKAVKTPALLDFLQNGNLICVYDGVTAMWLLVKKISGSKVEAITENDKYLGDYANLSNEQRKNLKLHYPAGVLLLVEKDEIISINFD